MRSDKIALIREDIDDTRRQLDDHADRLEEELHSAYTYARERAQALTPGYHWKHYPLGITAAVTALGIFSGRLIAESFARFSGRSKARPREFS